MAKKIFIGSHGGSFNENLNLKNFLKVIGILLAVVLLLYYIFIGSKKTKEITGYFVDPKDFYLKSSPVVIPKGDKPKDMVDALKKDKEELGLESLVPSGVMVMESYEDKKAKNTIVVNFNDEFLNVSYGVNGDILYVYSIVNTILKATRYGKVQILVNGNEVDELNESIYIKKPLTFNEDLD